LATIKDVAELAQVSTATVSHVINNTRSVRSSTKEKVNKAVKELNYKPNAIAQSLRNKKSKTIGLILPDNTNPYFAEIAWSIEYASRNNGYSVILCNSDGNSKREDFFIQLLIEKQIDGLILVSAGESKQNLLKLQKINIPVVLVDRNSPEISIDSVQIDNRAYGCIATKHLIALGHEKIACITGPNNITPSYDRVIGYFNALQEHCISINKDYVIRGDFKPQGGYLACKALMALPIPPTAVFACNDLMAYGVMRAIAEADLVISHDISLIGFDDIYLSAYTNPPLTTIRQPRMEMGQEAFRLLINRMVNPDDLTRTTLLDSKLITRSSTGRVIGGKE